MTKQIAINELKPKGFEEFDIKCLVETFRIIPVNALQTIFIGHKKDGTQLAQEYKKVSDTHVELVRNYEKS
jgi:hypothetical protein